MERGVFATEAEARSALQTLGREIEMHGVPTGTVRDTAGNIIVPVGKGGAAVYRVGRSASSSSYKPYIDSLKAKAPRCANQEIK